ncbi:MAG: hypothetical protein AAGB31_06070 [Bdellovibrio sp.]
MKSRHIIPLLSLTLLLGACSDGGGGNAAAPVPTTTVPPMSVPDATGNFGYEYTISGCTTGKHTFTSKKAYCNALVNDSLNKNCAREMRVEMYNRDCIQQNTGTIPGSNVANGGSAYCQVNSMDLRDRSFRQNMNPFNPQRRQAVRSIYWDAKREQAYNLTAMPAMSYGSSRFIMTPSSIKKAAQGEVLFKQKDRDGVFTATSGLGSLIRLTVEDADAETEVETLCTSHASFKRAKVDARKVKCTYSNGREIRGKAVRHEIPLITWNLKKAVEETVVYNRGGDAFAIRLYPATGGYAEKIEIAVEGLDIDMNMKAESTLNEGLSVSYKDKYSSEELSIECAVASK